MDFSGLIAILVVAGGVYAFFAATDKILKEEYRSLLAKRLREILRSISLSSPSESDWALLVTESFDAVFGRKLFSWKRIRNSWLISSSVSLSSLSFGR